MKVLHLIPTLASGGAERMLTRIVENDKNQHIIVLFKRLDRETVFYKVGETCTLISLDYESAKDLFSAIKKFFHFLDKYNPDVVQTWMYHANLFGGVLGHLKGYKNIIWNIRSAEVSFKQMRKKTILFAMIGALLSYFVPKRIVSCSNRAILVHQKILYNKDIFTYIPNGIQDEYLLDHKTVCNQSPVVGFVARLDPQKNHHTLLESLEYLETPIKLVLLGRGVDTLNLTAYRLNQHELLLFKDTDNVFEFYDSFDFLVLPSTYGEAFPNVLIEAMSRGVVCIASDIGDSWSIVSESGYQIASPQSARSIAKAIENAVSDFVERRDVYLEKSDCSIAIVKQKYRLSSVISQYNQAWSD